MPLNPNITYVIQPAAPLLEQAMDLLDTRTNVAHLLDRPAFLSAFFTVVAMDNDKVVGVATIKGGEASAKELGFLMVDPTYRRQGIAAALTSHRLRYAQEQGVSLLYSVIKESNLPSISNMQKHNFHFFGRYQSAMGSGLWFDWYYFPLHSENAIMEMHDLVGDRQPYLASSK